MPVIKSAKKALRQSRLKKNFNEEIRKKLRDAIRAFRKGPSEVNLKEVYSRLDRAAKNHVIHKNKASRLKGNFSKLITPGKKLKSK